MTRNKFKKVEHGCTFEEGSYKKANIDVLAIQEIKQKENNKKHR